MTSRILVTGSRNWTNRTELGRHLNHIVYNHPEPWILVHGDCPTGADAMAQEWADLHGIPTERHPANWETHGRAAGPIRNQEMVDLGAELCVAFLKPGSRGTRDCMWRARAAGIPVTPVRDWNDPGRACPICGGPLTGDDWQ